MEGKAFRLLILQIIIFLNFSCEQTVVSDTIFYFNDFETKDLSGITGGEITVFDGNKVLGTYFRSGFDLNLHGIPEHDYLLVTFDLFIHDSWDGNISSYIGPDLWFLLLDGQEIIYTSFANGLCNSVYCPQQTYPENGLRFNNPETGATKRNLPAWCTSNEVSHSSTLYSISKIVGHTSSKASVRFFDQLTNPTEDKCDESWSLDNLKITLLRTN